MVLKLDSVHPLVWRSPSSLQFGIDPARVRLDDVSLFVERMIAALTVGVSRPGLDMIASISDDSPAAVDQLLATLEPVLEVRQNSRQHTVLLTGSGPTVDRLVEILAASSVHTLIAATAEDARAVEADLAVAVGHFVLAPELHGLWLRRDIPHLPVVFTESSARIGPMIEPGETACLYCLDRNAIDEDAAWPAIASQLYSKRAAGETTLTAMEAAARAARLVLGRLDGEPQALTMAVLDAASGSTTPRESPMHPLCGCSTLEESDWAAEGHPGYAAPPLPTREKASSALA